MNILWINLMFYDADAVIIIHNDILPANQYPYTCTAKFMFVGDRNNKTHSTNQTFKDIQDLS